MNEPKPKPKAKPEPKQNKELSDNDLEKISAGKQNQRVQILKIH
jgi:hypothetical protein